MTGGAEGTGHRSPVTGHVFRRDPNDAGHHRSRDQRRDQQGAQPARAVRAGGDRCRRAGVPRGGGGDRAQPRRRHVTAARRSRRVSSRAGGRCWRERPDAILYPTVGFGGDIVQRYAHIAAARRGGADAHERLRSRLGESRRRRPRTVCRAARSISSTRTASATSATWRSSASSTGSVRASRSSSPGFLRATLAYHRAGRLPAGAFVKFYFGGDADYLGGARRAASASGCRRRARRSMRISKCSTARRCRGPSP